MSWSEDRMHRWLAGHVAPHPLVQSALAGSTGHDAAVLRARAERPVLCTDQTLEGVHFEAGTSAARIGRKAVARTLSDLAATAARPRAILVALAAPPTATESSLRAILRGALEEGARFEAALVGGDLAAKVGPLSIAVTAYGTLPGRTRAPGRDRAKPGQVLVSTGPTGGSRLGRHLRIEPRIRAGQALYAAGATALMDISDGLALDLDRLARASGVRVELERIAVHRDAHRAARQSGQSPRDHALFDGEDHELLATLSRRRWNDLRRSSFGRQLHELGRVVAGRGLFLPSEDGTRRVRFDGRGGWIHGS